MPRWTARLAAAAVVLVALTGCDVVPPATDAPSSAADTLAALTVAPAGPMRGYARDKFGGWRETGGNCDVRDEVLRRDGTKVKTSGCDVVAGTWTSPYDGRTLHSPAAVDIDHLVPLAGAWRSGASGWSPARREDFANDLDTPELVAVSSTANRAKGDQDPSTWRPPRRAAWCGYARDWITVKAHWRLTVTRAEKTALGDMLRRC